MALEDVGIVAELIHHGDKRGLYLGPAQTAIVREIHGHVVFLCLDVQQIVKGEAQVASPGTAVVEGDRDALLLVCRLFQQGIQLTAHRLLIRYHRGEDGDDDADDERPVNQFQTSLQFYGIVEQKARQQEIAQPYEQHFDEGCGRLMPNPPNPDAFLQRNDNQVIEQSATDKRNQAEGQRQQELIKLQN